MKKKLKQAILNEILKEKPYLKSNKKALNMAFKKRIGEIGKKIIFESASNSKMRSEKFGLNFKTNVKKAYVSYVSLLETLKKILKQAPSNIAISTGIKQNILSIISGANITPKVIFTLEKNLLKTSIVNAGTKMSAEMSKNFNEKFFKNPKKSNYDNNLPKSTITSFAENSLNKIKTQSPDIVKLLKKQARQVFQAGGRPEDFLKEIKKAEGFIIKRRNHMRFVARETFRQVNNDIEKETCYNGGLEEYVLIHHDNLSLKPDNIRRQHKDWASSGKKFKRGDPDPKEDPNCHCSKKWLVNISNLL